MRWISFIQPQDVLTLLLAAGAVNENFVFIWNQNVSRDIVMAIDSTSVSGRASDRRSETYAGRVPH